MGKLRTWWCERIVGHLWVESDARHLPSVYRLEVCSRCGSRQALRKSSAYGHPDIVAMVERLSHGDVDNNKAEWLAVRVHQYTGWAGRPIPWGQLSRERRREDILTARLMIMQAKADREGY